MKKRPSLKEINAQMDKLNKQKPSKKQIDELGEVIRKINEENGTDEKVIPVKKIAISDDRPVME
jgi:Tfp pilus assembly protein PilO